ncbi:kv channel-interacting protein 4 [Nephila pilipes]|uniref:Kv channel-interacting protein 4 n=1 Tax=Nephila pilipes TaxID=299642 RepID=A0A8X6NN90_NEPPI|nr:kv channel-interacting protein 4 [Nephila pilipes]
MYKDVGVSGNCLFLKAVPQGLEKQQALRHPCARNTKGFDRDRRQCFGRESSFIFRSDCFFCPSLHVCSSLFITPGKLDCFLQNAVLWLEKNKCNVIEHCLENECPTGYVEEDTFRFIFSHFFPYGNASLYAHYVFRTFDQNRNGAITFKDFIQCLSLMCRGTIQEKLQWAFKLYDLNGDGRITKKELTDIVCSVYALMGRRSFSGAEEKALRDHVDKTFLKMDINKDGVVTMDEFMEICSKDETIAQSLALFDTVL